MHDSHRLPAAIRSLLGIVLLATVVHAEVIYVDTNAPGSNTGTSWHDAYTDLQSALNSAWNTQVWVARGTYTPEQGSGSQSATFSCPC